MAADASRGGHPGTIPLYLYRDLFCVRYFRYTIIDLHYNLLNRFTKAEQELMFRLLDMNPDMRISAKDALLLPVFHIEPIKTADQ